MIFMAENQHESLNVKDAETSQRDLNLYVLRILHLNVQRFNNNLLQISISLSFGDINVDVLCFTEQCLRKNQLIIVYIEQLILVRNFSRFSRKSGFWHFCKKLFYNNDVDYLKSLGIGNTF